MPFALAALLIAAVGGTAKPAVAVPPSAAPVSAVTAAPQRDIVVTGRSTVETGRLLAACIARRCAVDEDIATSLAHAENQFVSGAYRDARVTLLAALHRDRRFASTFPVQVAGLTRANARVAAHLGETREYRIDSIDTLDALRAGLPDTDPRVIAQRIEVGDMLAHVGLSERAEATYRQAETQAHRLDLASLEGTARLHRITLALREGGDDLRARNGIMKEALRDLDELAAVTDPRLKSYALVARVMRAQYMAKKGDSAPLDALIAEMRVRGIGVRPVLVYSPVVKLGSRPEKVTADGAPPVYDSISRMSVGDFEKQWIDVSFWVKPDGSVGDVSVVRQSGPKAASWDEPILRAVAKRRYLPLQLAADDPGVLRVERYTYTSSIDDNFAATGGTRLRRRDGQPRIEMLDLTLDTAQAAAKPPGG